MKGECLFGILLYGALIIMAEESVQHCHNFVPDDNSTCCLPDCWPPLVTCNQSCPYGMSLLSSGNRLVVCGLSNISEICVSICPPNLVKIVLLGLAVCLECEPLCASNIGRNLTANMCKCDDGTSKLPETTEPQTASVQTTTSGILHIIDTTVSCRAELFVIYMLSGGCGFLLLVVFVTIICICQIRQNLRKAIKKCVQFSLQLQTLTHGDITSESRSNFYVDIFQSQAPTTRDESIGEDTNHYAVPGENKNSEAPTTRDESIGEDTNYYAVPGENKNSEHTQNSDKDAQELVKQSKKGIPKSKKKTNENVSTASCNSGQDPIDYNSKKKTKSTDRYNWSLEEVNSDKYESMFLTSLPSQSKMSVTTFVPNQGQHQYGNIEDVHSSNSDNSGVKYESMSVPHNRVNNDKERSNMIQNAGQKLLPFPNTPPETNYESMKMKNPDITLNVYEAMDKIVAGSTDITFIETKKNVNSLSKSSRKIVGHYSEPNIKSIDNIKPNEPEVMNKRAKSSETPKAPTEDAYFCNFGSLNRQMSTFDKNNTKKMEEKKRKHEKSKVIPSVQNDEQYNNMENIIETPKLEGTRNNQNDGISSSKNTFENTYDDIPFVPGLGDNLPNEQTYTEIQNQEQIYNEIQDIDRTYNETQTKKQTPTCDMQTDKQFLSNKKEDLPQSMEEDESGRINHLPSIRLQNCLSLHMKLQQRRNILEIGKEERVQNEEKMERNKEMK